MRVDRDNLRNPNLFPIFQAVKSHHNSPLPEIEEEKASSVPATKTHTVTSKEAIEEASRDHHEAFKTISFKETHLETLPTPSPTHGTSNNPIFQEDSSTTSSSSSSVTSSPIPTSEKASLKTSSKANVEIGSKLQTIQKTYPPKNIQKI